VSLEEGLPFLPPPSLGAKEAGTLPLKNPVVGQRDDENCVLFAPSGPVGAARFFWRLNSSYLPPNCRFKLSDTPPFGSLGVTFFVFSPPFLSKR